jgi:hypothetical protein
MPTRKLKKPAEGEKMPLTADMIAWKKEFDEMDLDAHKAKLKALGLDDDELAEFEEMEEGAPLEDEIMHEGPLGKEEEPAKKKAKKKVAKKKTTKKK